jgi:ribosome-associated protein
MQPIVFELNSEYIELCNLLKIVGIADSGGHGKMMVADGIVKVDGQLELRKTAKIKANQYVEIGAQTIQVTQGELNLTQKTKVKTQKLSNKSPFQLKTPKQKLFRKR